MAEKYDLRYFTTPITTSNWAEATQIIADPIEEPEPELAGQRAHSETVLRNP